MRGREGAFKMELEDNKDYDSANIHLKWLEKIYSNLDNIENMERISREGCNTLLDYIQIPPQIQRTMLAEVQYKNMRFLIIEMNMLINNIEPIIKLRADDFRKDLSMIMENIDNRKLFLKETKSNGNTVAVSVTPFFGKTLMLLASIKTNIIKDIGHLLYLPGEKPKW